jgi:hypothetical protein
MTNQLPALPSHLQQVQGWGLLENGLKGIGGARGPHLSIKDNDFTLVEENGQRNIAGSFDAKVGGRYLHAVIVGISKVKSRIYWGDVKFVSGQENYEPPACFSHDGIHPSPDAEAQQNPTCMLCPQAAWGPGKPGTPPKCQDGKRIVLWVPEKGFYWFRITPGSFKNWQSYLDFLKNNPGGPVEPQYVLTRFQFVSQGILAFVADSFVTEDMVKGYNQPETIARLLDPTSRTVQTIAPTFVQPTQIAPPGSFENPAVKVSFENPVYNSEPMPTATLAGVAEPTKRKRATKAEMEARRNGNGHAEINVPPVPAPVFGQSTPEVLEDPALKAALAAAFNL